MNKNRIFAILLFSLFSLIYPNNHFPITLLDKHCDKIMVYGIVKWVMTRTRITKDTIKKIGWSIEIPGKSPTSFYLNYEKIKEIATRTDLEEGKIVMRIDLIKNDEIIETFCFDMANYDEMKEHLNIALYGLY